MNRHMETNPMTSVPLAVLIVEDVESDAQLILRLLRKAGYELVYEQVETEPQMRAALESRVWDLVISDYSLPQFNGVRALEVLGESDFDIPFIVVSGTVGEQTAVSMMKAGAHDYLMKDNLARLVPAVQRELEQARIRRERRRAEQLRAASEAELRALFASMQDLVMVIDRQGIYRKIAPTNQNLLVEFTSELVGKKLEDIFSSAQAEYFITAIRQVLDGGQPAQIEYQLQIDGNTYWFETSISQMDENDALCVARDITERRRAQEQLREGEEKYRTLFDSLPDAVTLIGLDGRILICNEATAKLAKTTKEQLVGRHFTTLGMLDPLEMPKYLRIFTQLLAGKKECSLEVEINRGDERRRLEVFVTLLTMRGQVNAIQVIAHDLTRRLQAEKALEASESQLRALVEQVPAIVYTESAEDRWTTYISPQVERIAGYTPEEWIADRDLWQRVIHPDDRDMVVEVDRLTTLTHEPFQTEYRILTRDGRELWIRDEAVLIQSADGAPLFWQGVMYDITERKQMEDALRERNEQLGLLYDASQRLSKTLDLQEIYQAVYDFMSAVAPNDGLLISSFDSETQLIICRAYVNRYGWQDVSAFPPIPLGDEGKGTQSMAIHTGQSLLLNDYQSQLKTSKISYYVEDKTNTLYERVPQGAEEITRSAMIVPLKIGERVTGVIQVMSNRLNAYNETQLKLLESLSLHIASAEQNALLYARAQMELPERRRAEEDIRQRISQLEILYQNGLALGKLLNPREIGRKILELLEEKLNWSHTSICLYDPEDDSLKLLDFNQPGLENETKRYRIEENFNQLIANSGDGLTGWALKQSRPIRCGDVTNDPHYVETYPGIRSGLYVPIKLGDRMIGVIEIESEQPDAFSEADERLVVTLANQAASAFENARLFEETRQRVIELETLNRVSLVLRSALSREEMLAIILDEALFLLNTPHGSIELYNKATETFDKIVTRGWLAELKEAPQTTREGIVGKVYTSGEVYISREIANDPETRNLTRKQVPPGWGGICVPIRTTQQTLGVVFVSVPTGREFDPDETRLLSILSEMTGGALQRMQLHEQTVRRLEQLNALRAVDQAISSSRDMQLTLNILLSHTISQLNIDAADVLLLSAGSSRLEFAAGQGFRILPHRILGLNDRFAGRAVMQRRLVTSSDIDALDQSQQTGKLWRDEGFLRGWCLPLIVKGEVKGVLEVYSRRAFTPDAEWLEFLGTFAGQAAIAIDNTQLFENLQRANVDLSLAYEATIEGWSMALDMRDHETEGHTLRVTELTLSLAQAMGVGELQLANIRRGALLHDIGKMGVPDSILLKDGSLTDEEWEIMRRHPQFARDMLLPITYLRNALDIPYCHHEKWDGTGYPQGLKEEQIPLAARIFAVVDVWDALTNDRTYRKKWEQQKALQYIMEQSGKHFDPQVVETFLRHIGRG